MAPRVGSEDEDEDAADTRRLFINYDGNRWTMHKLIARGGFSKVYQAKTKEQSKILACKVALQRTHPKTFMRFYNTEKSCGMLLLHPNIVSVLAHKLMARRATYMLLMEYCSYGDLTGIFDRREPQISIRHCRCLLRQLASAVEYMHFKKVAHRDLKLENILIAGNSGESHDHLSIRVADFGLSSIQTKMTFSRPGTRYTMAPEMLCSTGPYDPYPADIWAVGVIGFCLLNGTYPFAFRESSRRQVYEQKRGMWRKRCHKKLLQQPHPYKFLETVLTPMTSVRPSAKELRRLAWLQSPCRWSNVSPGTPSIALLWG